MFAGRDAEAAMKTQTVLGWLFVVIGLVILAISLGPAVYALQVHGPHVDPSYRLLGIGLGVTFFGAWLLPSSHVGTTVREVRVELADTNIPFIGRGRNGATVSVTDTTSSSSASAPPRDAGV